MTTAQQVPYIPSVDEIYANATPQLNRRVLPMPPSDMPGRLSPVKPLRIIIIRHAERADAVLGSEWSKKSFDRQGRYIRFSEHLPETYVRCRSLAREFDDRRVCFQTT